MNLNNITEQLKEKYKSIIKDFDNNLNTNKALELPRLAAPYQFHYHNLLKEYSKLSDKIDKYVYEATFNYKIQNSELSHITLSSSELKKMIETSDKYIKYNSQRRNLSNDMKIVEEMMRSIKDFNFSINNTIKYKELMGK